MICISRRRFEATTSAGYLLQTLAPKLARDRDLHFKCNPAKVYGRGRAVSIMVTVIKPEVEIGFINFEDGCILIESMPRGYHSARSWRFSTPEIFFLNWIFYPFIPHPRVASIATRDHIWIHNWQLFFFIPLVHISSSLPSPSPSAPPVLCLTFTYFLPIRSANKMRFNSDVWNEKERHADIKLRCETLMKMSIWIYASSILSHLLFIYFSLCTIIDYWI